MQVCTWAEDGYGPFNNSCANLPSKNAVLQGFGVSGCIGSTDDTSSIDVPHAYLGPGVYQDARGIADLQLDSFCDNIDYWRRSPVGSTVISISTLLPPWHHVTNFLLFS